MTKSASRRNLASLPEAETNEVLFDALRAVYAFEREKVAAFGLDYAAIYLLQYLLRHAGAPISQVAGEMRVPISTISRMLDRLEKDGLVARTQDSADGRRFLLSLKPKARALVARVERHSFERLAENLGRLPPESIDVMIAAARLLPAVLEVPNEEPGR